VSTHSVGCPLIGGHIEAIVKGRESHHFAFEIMKPSALFREFTDGDAATLSGGFDVTGPKGLVDAAGDPTLAVYGIDKQTAGDAKAAFFTGAAAPSAVAKWETGPALPNDPDARGFVPAP